MWQSIPGADRSCPTTGLPAGSALAGTLQRELLPQDSGSVLSESSQFRVCLSSQCSLLSCVLLWPFVLVSYCLCIAGVQVWCGNHLPWAVPHPGWQNHLSLTTLAKTWYRTRLASLDPVEDQKSCAVLTLRQSSTFTDAQIFRGRWVCWFIPPVLPCLTPEVN